MEVLLLLPSFSMKTHGMHMMQSVEGMDLNLEISHYVWNTHEEEQGKEEHGKEEHGEEDAVEDSPREDEVDLKHGGLTSG